MIDDIYGHYGRKMVTCDNCESGFEAESYRDAQERDAICISEQDEQGRFSPVWADRKENGGCSMNDKARLEELKRGVSVMVFFTQSRLTNKASRRTVVEDGKAIQALLDAAIARLDSTVARCASEDVQRAIDYFNEVLPYMGGDRGLVHFEKAITALRQMKGE